MTPQEERHFSGTDNEKEPRKRGAFWRERLNVQVVDLRSIAKKREKNKEADISFTKRKELISTRDVLAGQLAPKRGTLPDSYYADEYLGASPALKSAPQIIVEKAPIPAPEEPLSRDALMAELASIDNDDLKIQAELAKERKTTIPSISYFAANQSSSYQQNQNRKNLQDFGLISNYSSTLKEELAGSRPAGKRKRFFTILFIAIAGVALGLAGRLAVDHTNLNVQLTQAAEEHARIAFNSLLEGREALEELNAEEAQQHFEKATREFIAVEDSFGFASRETLRFSASFPIQTRVSSAAHLIRAGKLFSSAGLEASYALRSLQQTREAVPGAAVATDRGLIFSNPLYLTDDIVSARRRLEKAMRYISSARSHLTYVRAGDIPAGYRSEVLAAQQESSDLIERFEATKPTLEILLSILGHTAPKKYFIMFQNSSELRATGGFIGTYGILELNKGNLDDLFINGIYDPDGQLTVKVVPPRPLQYITPNWETRDANWFFDFPTSAKKVSWFFQQTEDTELDGVIALNPLVVEKLLVLSGPIELPQYGITVTNENFLELVQQEVEVDYDRELNRPKQILSDLAPVLFERVIDSAPPLELYDLLRESLVRKDVMLYSTDGHIQEFFSTHGFSGEVSDGATSTTVVGDYLAVVMTNIAGGKADRFTETEIDTVTRVEGDGSIVRNVLIARQHNGGSTPYAWYNKANRSYVRVYVPRGSTLISAEGFSALPVFPRAPDYDALSYIRDAVLAVSETSLIRDQASDTDVFEESGRTVFGNWLRVQPGEREFARVTYRLPYTMQDISDSYELTIQKQSGLDAKYSGSIEEFHDFLSLKFCGIGGNSFTPQNFQFVQTQDVALRCSIVHE